MATPTSSSNRSKRKTTKPVTQGQNPQRSNRQKVSSAKVTNDGSRVNRGARVTNASQRTNTGSARVTGTTPKALPPGKTGGQLAKQSTPPNQRRLQAKAKLDNAAQGTTGPNRVGQPSGAANRVYGANVVNNAVRRAQGSARLGRNISVGRGGAAATALGALNMIDDARLTSAQRAKKYDVVNPDRGQNLLTKFQSGTLGQPNKTVKPDPNGRSSQGVNTPKGRTVATGSQQYNDYRNKQIADNRERLKGVGNPAETKPPAPPRRNPPAPSADQRRSSGGGNNTAPRSQTPPKPRFTGTADEGRKMWAEKYSSSKYDGQAIQKEAKKLLDEMKKRKEDKSNAQRAGWDGNKNY